jgi:hypothetical protein
LAAEAEDAGGQDGGQLTEAVVGRQVGRLHLGPHSKLTLSRSIAGTITIALRLNLNVAGPVMTIVSVGKHLLRRGLHSLESDSFVVWSGSTSAGLSRCSGNSGVSTVGSGAAPFLERLPSFAAGRFISLGFGGLARMVSPSIDFQLVLTTVNRRRGVRPAYLDSPNRPTLLSVRRSVPGMASTADDHLFGAAWDGWDGCFQRSRMRARVRVHMC